jgi:hypothetical protein
MAQYQQQLAAIVAKINIESFSPVGVGGGADK